MDFKAVVLKVDNPVLGDTVARVYGLLGLAIQIQRAVGDLDDEHGGGRVRFGIIPRPAGNHGDIGLWFGHIVERQGHLHADIVVSRECDPQGVLDQPRGN